jgi:drug/metabolite transporter (DMT)-like permease
VIVGLVGIVLIQQPGSTGGFGGSNWAVALALLSSLTSAVALIGLHQIKQLDPRSIVAHFSAVALAFSIGALWLLPHEHGPPLEPHMLLTLLGIGLCATIGQLFLTLAFSSGPPARVSVVGLAQVGFTMLLEMAFWSRTFSGLTLLGIGLVIAPTAWTLLRARRQPRA